MLNRFGLDRFKKAQSAEPFSVNTGGAVITSQPPIQGKPSQASRSVSYAGQLQAHAQALQTAPALEPPTPLASAQATTLGNGQSTWQPPDWAVEPKPSVYWLEVVKDGEILDRIPLDKRRHIFGRQVVACDFVLDHPSVSRQHAAVVQHKNGSIFVIDLGSVHGTFVANERLTKDNPLELEVGQSLRFAASTRSYILRKSAPQTLQLSHAPVNIILPPPPDPSDEEAVVAYNTTLNRLNVASFNNPSSMASPLSDRSELDSEMPNKKLRKARVTFRDQYDGVLVEVVGVSDGADVGTEPGPIGVKEGSLVGKYESLVQVTVIPKGQEEGKQKAESSLPKGVTQKLQQCFQKVKSPAKGGLYGDLYGDSFAGEVGASWANSAKRVDEVTSVTNSVTRTEKGIESNGPTQSALGARNVELQEALLNPVGVRTDSAFDNDDLFGDDDEENPTT